MAFRVLLADDQVATRTIVRFNLEQAGLEVLEATDGLNAFKTLNDFTVDLVVTDEVMPRLSGLDLCRKIRETPRLAALRIIMITATAPTPSGSLLEELGIAHCFTKPFSPRALTEKVREVLRCGSIDDRRVVAID